MQALGKGWNGLQFVVTKVEVCEFAEFLLQKMQFDIIPKEKACELDIPE